MSIQPTPLTNALDTQFTEATGITFTSGYTAGTLSVVAVDGIQIKLPIGRKGDGVFTRHDVAVLALGIRCLRVVKGRRRSLNGGSRWEGGM